MSNDLPVKLAGSVVSIHMLGTSPSGLPRAFSSNPFIPSRAHHLAYWFRNPLLARPGMVFSAELVPQAPQDSWCSLQSRKQSRAFVAKILLLLCGEWQAFTAHSKHLIQVWMEHSCKFVDATYRDGEGWNIETGSLLNIKQKKTRTNHCSI